LIPIQKFPVKVICKHSNHEIEGEIHMQRMTVIDTPGFMLFDEGIICDKCLVEMGGSDPNTRLDEQPSRKEDIYQLRRPDTQ
jgi:hypothetical protein